MEPLSKIDGFRFWKVVYGPNHLPRFEVFRVLGKFDRVFCLESVRQKTRVMMTREMLLSNGFSPFLLQGGRSK